MEDSLLLPVRSQATVGRVMLHSIGTGRAVIVLKGKYMAPSVRTTVQELFDDCESSGATVVFNDGYSDRNVLIKSFETVPIVGKTEGFGFRLELQVVG